MKNMCPIPAEKYYYMHEYIRNKPAPINKECPAEG